MTCPHIPALALLLAATTAACDPAADEPTTPPAADDGKLDQPEGSSLCPERARSIAFLPLEGRILDLEVEDGLAVLSRRAPHGVCVYDLRNVRNPEELSCIDPPGDVSGLDLEEGVLYAAVRDQGLWIYDLGTPEAPVLLSSLVTDTKSWDVTVAGGLAYLADGGFGLRVVDVTAPSEPTLRGSLPLDRHTFPAFTSDVAVRGTVAYVAAGTLGLAAVDVADPDAPQLLASVAVEGSVPDSVHAISLSGERAYAAVEDGWALTSFDLTDPAAPELVASSRGARWGLDVVSAGDVAAVTCENDELCLYRGDDLAAPVDRVRARGEVMALGYEAGHVFYASEDGWGADETGLGVVRIACR